MHNVLGQGLDPEIACTGDKRANDTASFLWPVSDWINRVPQQSYTISNSTASPK